MRSTKRKTSEEFIEDARKIHGDKYDYSKVVYVNQLTPVCIICPVHGEFWQKPKVHLMGRGCRKCGDERGGEINKIRERKKICRKKYNTELFIKEGGEIHNNKYDYSKVEYKNKETKVCIICPEHGEFWQRPYEHLNQKSGCPKCANISRHNLFAKTQNDFINKANEIFKGKYTYDNVKYYNTATKVLITCPEHGDFACTPSNHLKGRGCPICKAEGYVYENRLYILLLTIFDKNDIIRQYKSTWLSNNKSLDFYVPKYRIAIEHQGEQHISPVSFLGGEIKLKRTQELDKEKYEECIEQNVTLFYFTYQNNVCFDDFFEKVYKNEDELIKEIKNKIKEKYE